MKRILCFCVVTAFLLPMAGLTQDQKPALSDPKDKQSYAIGTTLGKSMKQQGLEINLDMFVKGMKDAFSGAAMLLSDKEIADAMTAFQTEMMAKAQEKNKVAGEKNKKEGETFLAANKTKPGIVTTASGMQYKILAEGKEANKPQATDTVTVNYRGTLIDGTEFDSSYKRGTPATFQVNGVIKGWVEALQLMTVGSKYQLFIPGELAYGPNGAPPNIGPSALLIFEVELVSIK